MKEQNKSAELTISDYKRIKQLFTLYINKNPSPSVEGFIRDFKVDYKIIYNPYFYETHLRLQAITIAKYRELLSNGYIKLKEYEDLVNEEKSRPFKRSVKKMYQMLIDDNWQGLPPKKEELQDVADYEKKLLQNKQNTFQV